MTLTAVQASRLTTERAWFRFWMPYAFTKLEHPRLKHVWLPLNRAYKPLGIASPAHVDYQAFLPQAVSFGVDPKTFVGIWNHVDEDLWLYQEGEKHLGDYFVRLQKLMSHAMELTEAVDALREDVRSWSRSGRRER